jgi:hypothetical protein
MDEHPYRRTMTWTHDTLSRLGEALAQDGMVAHEPELRDLAVAARAAGLRPSLAALLTDATAPAPVRGRAFALVARVLSATGSGRASPHRLVA